MKCTAIISAPTPHAELLPKKKHRFVPKIYSYTFRQIRTVLEECKQKQNSLASRHVWSKMCSVYNPKNTGSLHDTDGNMNGVILGHVRGENSF